ncbi:hypothetical protein [Neobacillus terrae]|uniref:hypothetical protein n=1 Tax=Neobacillus terrae TaxID=3034837 RepID=UPI00140D2FA7|nr:hypothetical protein [Neobacillus terrae]NHM33778.1 hypothetical protein [Neobacillus terrae]
MKARMIITWIILLIYLIIVIKKGLVEKKQRKWVYLVAALTVCITLCVVFEIPVHIAMEFLNNKVGGITKRMVEK